MKFALILVSALVGQALANPVADADASRRELEVSFIFWSSTVPRQTDHDF
jgi:hypothetical protein